MKIILKTPPNYDEITKVFDLSKSQPLFAYGEDIYNPHNSPISPDLLAHEQVHIIQMLKYGDTKKWWDKYLKDKKFRLEQEIEAYGIQYLSFKGVVNEKMASVFLTRFAAILSGDMYGKMLSLQEAESKIRNYAKNCIA